VTARVIAGYERGMKIAALEETFDGLAAHYSTGHDPKRPGDVARAEAQREVYEAASAARDAASALAAANDRLTEAHRRRARFL
jgi:hypothetical protein